MIDALIERRERWGLSYIVCSRGRTSRPSCRSSGSSALTKAKGLTSPAGRRPEGTAAHLADFRYSQVYA